MNFHDLGIKSAIEELSKRAFDNSRRHGFWKDFDRTLFLLMNNAVTDEESKILVDKYALDTRLHKIALMHSELGEMTEGVRKPGPDQHCPEFTQEEIELADTLIRAFDYAGAFDLRLAEAILAKMEYNASRPYKHGKGA